MRKIKFRAWDSMRSTMLYFDEIGFNASHNQLVLGKCMDGQIPTEPLMQFTGLKDKNGKEIYEGDIVRVKNLKTFSNIQVKYEKVAGSDDMGTDMIGFPVNEYCEIVGNIYENPEMSPVKGV